MKFLRINPDEIIRCVSVEMNVTIDEIKGSSRRMKIVTARHTAIYLARKYSNYKFIQLSELFNRNASSMFHAVENVKAWNKYSKPYRQVFEGVEASLRGLYIDK